MKNILEKVEELVAKSKTSFIASIDDEGYPLIKAMLAPEKREGLRTFWIQTNTGSQHVAQYRKNPHASLYFYERGRFNYQGVVFKGRMEVLTDAATKEMLWHVGDTMYYEEGVTDPDYCVIKFTAEAGRYYSNFKSENFKMEVKK